MTTLLVDAGGTWLRTAYFDGKVGAHRHEPADHFDSLTQALASRCAEDGIRPKRAVIAVAGPVRGDRVAFTNRPWAFSRAELKTALGLVSLQVLNDFAAVALALPHLEAADIDVIARGEPLPANPMLALGPGTGLGMACAVPAGGGWVALPGEGGHATAALDGLIPHAAQQRLWKDGRLCWEDILSGGGLTRLHRALHPSGAPASPEAISAAARDGDAPARDTLYRFALALGRRASDAALTFGAWGGVFLAGGMIGAMGDLFRRDAFLKGFLEKGSASALAGQIPIALITRPDPAFVGLVHAARDRDRDR